MAWLGNYSVINISCDPVCVMLVIKTLPSARVTFLKRKRENDTISSRSFSCKQGLDQEKAFDRIEHEIEIVLKISSSLCTPFRMHRGVWQG